MEPDASKHPEVIKFLDEAAAKIGFTDTTTLLELKAAIEMQPPARTGNAATEIMVRHAAVTSHQARANTKLGGSVLDPLFNALLGNKALAAKLGVDCSKKVSTKRLASRGQPRIEGLFALHANSPLSSALFVSTKPSEPNLIQSVTQVFNKFRSN